MTPREAFCAALGNGPLMSSGSTSRGDAIVVLSGDGETRLQTGLELFNRGLAPLIVVSGGINNPPHSLDAFTAEQWLILGGVPAESIIREETSQNTQEQAQRVVDMAMDRDWDSLLLVASPYHQYRAYLTFLATLIDLGWQETIHLINAPASHTKWWESPVGMDTTRSSLLSDEFRKIEDYHAKGHVASYKEGLAYLAYWEHARDAVALTS